MDVPVAAVLTVPGWSFPMCLPLTCTPPPERSWGPLCLTRAACHALHAVTVCSAHTVVTTSCWYADVGAPSARSLTRAPKVVQHK